MFFLYFEEHHYCYLKFHKQWYLNIQKPNLMFQQGEITMEVMFVAPDEDSDDESKEFEDEHGFRCVLN